MSEERFWNIDEYASTAKFAVSDGAMTMRQAGRIFRLDPAPPKVEDIKDYIVSAIREQDNTYFTYFLHQYESRLNKRVYRFLLTEKNKKIAVAAYEYKAVHRYANDDDEWGEIRFDFSAGTAQIVNLADGDLSRTNVFAKIAIRQILKLSMSELPKKLTIPFELELEKIRYGS